MTRGFQGKYFSHLSFKNSWQSKFLGRYSVFTSLHSILGESLLSIPYSIRENCVIFYFSFSILSFLKFRGGLCFEIKNSQHACTNRISLEMTAWYTIFLLQFYQRKHKNMPSRLDHKFTQQIMKIQPIVILKHKNKQVVHYSKAESSFKTLNLQPISSQAV